MQGREEKVQGNKARGIIPIYSPRVLKDEQRETGTLPRKEGRKREEKKKERKSKRRRNKRLGLQSGPRKGWYLPPEGGKIGG